MGRLSVVRASQVAPYADGQWLADLGPVGGPVLGPFSRRNAALTAEVSWISRHFVEQPSR